MSLYFGNTFGDHMKILFIVYDNGSYVSQFPIGIAQLTSILEKKGYDVTIYNQDIHHYSEEHLTAYLNTHHFDVVGISFIGGYWQFRKAKAISAAIAAANRKPFYIIGGHGPAPEPEYFLKLLQADVACIGEGDETIVELFEILGRNLAPSQTDLSSIKGIAYRIADKVYVNERRSLIQNIDELPFPAYHRFPMNVYRLLRMPHCSSTDFVATVLSGRGCTFKCNFCYRMDEGLRLRSNESIIEEIQLLKKDYGITYIAFFDELLVSSIKRATLLCEDFIKHNINIKWDCNGRLNYAQKDLLKLMKRAGCVFINYGIECFDDTILRIMHKGLTTSQIERGIKATLDAGISPGLNIIFGNHGENRQTLQKGVDFLLRYDDGAQLRTIRPVTPYPGSQLYYDAIQMGKLKDCADFYENKHTNSDLLTVNFTQLSDSDFYAALHEANTILLKNYTAKHAKRNSALLDDLYRKHDSNFRGFRHA